MGLMDMLAVFAKQACHVNLKYQRKMTAYNIALSVGLGKTS
jgi:hypothetical protein